MSSEPTVFAVNKQNRFVSIAVNNGAQNTWNHARQRTSIAGGVVKSGTSSECAGARKENQRKETTFHRKIHGIHRTANQTPEKSQHLVGIKVVQMLVIDRNALLGIILFTE